jgi:hypothetical protein
MVERQIMWLLLLALASCAEAQDERVPFHVGWSWRFPPGLHKPTPHYFPYSLPDKEDTP